VPRLPDAGLVLAGHAGYGLEQRAEQELQFTGGDVTAERAVVEAALQQRLEQHPDLENMYAADLAIP
jgi:hypothetical protein